MGILSGKDLFKSKFITAQIIDASHRVYFVPIKHTIGDYFLASINSELYVFKIDGPKQLTYRHTASRSFQVIIYSTDNYLPLSIETNELKQILEKHGFNKVDRSLLKLFKTLSIKEKNKEKKEKKEKSDEDKDEHGNVIIHDLDKFLISLEKKKEKGENLQLIQDLINFIDELPTKQIITPLQKVSDFLDKELLTTDPKFLGSIVDTYNIVKHQHGKITNSPTNSSMPWLKFLAITMAIGMVIGIAYYAYDQGYFDSILAPFDGITNSLSGFDSLTISGPTLTPEERLMQQYPTPEELNLAIAKGEVKYDSLPEQIRKEIDLVGLPPSITNSTP